MQSTEIQGAQKLMKNFASTKNTPGSITTSKLGNKVAASKASKNLQNINKQQQFTRVISEIALTSRDINIDEPRLFFFKFCASPSLFIVRS